MILNLKNLITPNGKVVSLVDLTGRNYFSVLNSDAKGEKAAREWAAKNKFLVL